MNIVTTKNLRKINVEKVLNTMMEQDTCTKNELTDLTGLSLGSVNTILKQLMEEKKVEECGYNESTGGRRSMSYRLNGDYSKTLCISIFRNSNRVHISYKVFNLKDEVKAQKAIIKKNLSLQDLYDVIDTVLATNENVKVIGFSIPGIIEDGYVISTNIPNFDNINFNELKNRYNQNIVVGNDVNTAAIGFYLAQTDYENVAILFQPSIGFAGIGMVVNGKLLLGKSHIAGEVQYLPTGYSADTQKLLSTPKGCEELITKEVQTIIAMINPDAIGICCYFMTEFDGVIRNLKKVFRKADDLPEIIYIGELGDYILTGVNMLCKETLTTNLVMTRKKIV